MDGVDELLVVARCFMAPAGEIAVLVDTADDLVVIPYRMNVTNYNGYAKFEIASTLHSVTNNPYVITVLSDAIYTTISGLDFTYYGSGGDTTTDNASLGSMGRVIDVVANYVTVSDCTSGWLEDSDWP